MSHFLNRKTRSRQKPLRTVIEFALVIVLAFVIAFLLRTFVFQAFFVPSQSMEDTLQIDDRVIASKITTKIDGVQRGEVLVFEDPSDWLPEPVPTEGIAGALQNFFSAVGVLPSTSGKDLVKRVIGIAGDTVECCDTGGHLILNGVPVDEPYIKPGSSTDQITFSVTVPEGHFFALGDNRAQSSDSRFHLDENDGVISEDLVIGRVVLRFWPLDRFGTVPIEDPAEYALESTSAE